MRKNYYLKKNSRVVRFHSVFIPMLFSKVKKLPSLRSQSFLKYQSTSNSKSHSFHWKNFENKTAVIDSVGKFSYNSLFHGATKLSQILTFKG